MTNLGDFSMLELFREEARAHAAALSAGLLELEGDAASPQRIEPLMRAAHSLKGAARIVGIDAAVRLAHALEDAFVGAQHGRVQVHPVLIDCLLRGTDILATLGDITDGTMPGWSAAHTQEIDAALSQLHAALMGTAPVRPAPISPLRPAVEPTYRPPPRGPITLPEQPILIGEEQPLWDLFREELRGGLMLLINELKQPVASVAITEQHVQAAQAIRGAAVLVDLTPAAELVAGVITCLSRLSETKQPPSAEVYACLWRASELLSALVPLEHPADWRSTHAAEIEALCRTGFRPVHSARPTPHPAEPTPPPPSAPVPSPSPDSIADTPAPQHPKEAEAVVRVTAGSLNRLLNLAGESLVQARWLQPFATSLLKLKKQHDRLEAALGSRSTAGAEGDDAAELLAKARQELAQRLAEFEDHAARAEDLNSRLYREVIVSRMRPFGDGTHGFPRLVRDMARQLGKQVRFDLVGQDTEVDRDVLEKLEAPLTHLLRNALDHGLETPDERRLAGKHEGGTLRLEARHRAGRLAITVSDDGRGIDLDKLRKKIVERGLTTAVLAQAMRAQEVLEFLFLPGFSTAAKVTEFSGRGVGLDVVQDTVRKLGGSVHITTELGQGTRFHLQLPITLSVVRGVLVTIGGEPYALPHSRIDRLLCVPRAAVRSVEHSQFTTVDGVNIGLVLAGQLLELPLMADQAEVLNIVLLSSDGLSYGLIVEAFLGEQDLVVRPLDPRLGKVPGLSAAAILDDGSPVLIVDVEDLVRAMDRFIQTGTLQRWEPRAEARQAQKRILVADDSITVREVERQILLGEGYDVSVAVDGKEAWNLLRASPFDLLISDVDMPNLTGLELIRAVRSDNRLKDLPVIIVSYKERQEDRLKGLEVGASAYLTKSSFHDNTFVQAVKDLIG